MLLAWHHIGWIAQFVRRKKVFIAFFRRRKISHLDFSVMDAILPFELKNTTYQAANLRVLHSKRSARGEFVQIGAPE